MWNTNITNIYNIKISFIKSTIKYVLMVHQFIIRFSLWVAHQEIIGANGDYAGGQ